MAKETEIQIKLSRKATGTVPEGVETGKRQKKKRRKVETHKRRKHGRTQRVAF
jgi:hypothetical protein